MNRIVWVLCALALIVVSTAACGIETTTVRSYCDAEVSYIVTKYTGTESGHRLYLRVGPSDKKYPCLRLNQLDNRAVNLEQDVASLDDAVKLIDQHRQQYATKLAQAPEKK